MRTFALLVLLVSCAAALHAQTDEYSRRTLAGLQGVPVIVEDFDPSVPHPGIEKTDIQTDVELKLREAGIPVQEGHAPGTPYLYVNLSLARRTDIPLYAYNIDVQLVQFVRLDRNPSISVFAVTWHSIGSFGTLGENNLRGLRLTVGDQVNQFINAYLAVNQKR